VTAARKSAITGRTSVEAVLDKLRAGIRSGRYAPGQRLVTSDLARELNVSLSPIREAIHILVGEGLVAIDPNKGPRIRSLSAQTFIDGLQVLDAIGVLAFRLLAPRITGGALMGRVPEIRKTIADAGRRRNPHAFFEAIANSHRFANDLSGNAYLNPILNRLHLEYFYRQMAECLPDNFWDQYVNNYDRMGEHLFRGDARSAERVWRRHIRWLIGLIRTYQQRVERNNL
jgi:DNA-binding GntR family transcriptional regulator